MCNARISRTQGAHNGKQEHPRQAHSEDQNRGWTARVSVESIEQSFSCLSRSTSPRLHSCSPKSSSTATIACRAFPIWRESTTTVDILDIFFILHIIFCRLSDIGERVGVRVLELLVFREPQQKGKARCQGQLHPGFHPLHCLEGTVMITCISLAIQNIFFPVSLWQDG
jgi:hypothetical protein